MSAGAGLSTFAAMSLVDTQISADRRRRRFAWVLRAFMVVFLAAAVAVIWVSNAWLTQQFTETTRNRAEIRLAIYSGTIQSELQRHSVVPLLLARDPVLIRSLETASYVDTTARLISYVDEIGAASLVLLDRDGRIVAATDRERLGQLRSADPFFVEASRSPDTVFTSNEPETGRFDFTFSRAMRSSDNRLLGVILVEVDLARIVDRWRGTTEAIFLTNSQGAIILSTEPRWRGRTEVEALALQPPQSAIQRALRATGDFAFGEADSRFFGNETIRLESRIPFRGWRIVSYTAYTSVRERVNAVLALQIMGFALALAGGFYLISRRARLRSDRLARESAELRRLNGRLQREIAERQRVERTLEEAEQSLAQSQKLAALGEMSAAVSHELNQPLAAMKTYLAGARLLLQRKRIEEAASSFQRIDDLIDRMGAITRQLKSYARKGGDALEPVDLRDALKGALTMMEPQLRTTKVEITRNLPRQPVMVLADRLRLEQVIINLLRNALDAMKDVPKRELDLLISEGEEAVLTVRDNGNGIDDLDALFEPFYTTKKPGEGVGLGLAISSGIVTDLGGRLTARNGETGGAVFEIRMPLIEGGVRAAQ
ncbi:two-component system C4-dicarboxylate transport sensor histidine kinase DctB [Roseicyclus mahoneyensis]|uniref:C4-dicarboxylate transport sensor protein DctB n=2 Tax=Roseicyclus mahoneyensis TaxID=164332 RepID=A0A316GMK3_9RHOB|nr:two-component system C4-dicarboxylate transport sensor histidine kinase DctB [Roseicyclus mahoneyensis]